MATVIASNLVVFSDATGHGNQSHLVYAVNQQRWWLFVIKTKTATTVSTYVSTSNDLRTATWSASTDSPVFPGSHALTSNDRRNLGVVGFANGSTDVAHVNVSIGPTGSSVTGNNEHVRCTFTGASSVTWEAWNDGSSVSGTWTAVKGDALGVTADGFVHRGSQIVNFDGNANVAVLTNADTTSTWTNGSTGSTNVETVANDVQSWAFAPVASNLLLMAYDDGGAADPNCTGIHFAKSATHSTWTASSGAAVAAGTTTQDKNDWCLCGVDTTHVYAFRRSGASSFACRMYNGTAWSTPASTVPTQNHLAGSGMFAATDGTGLWLFILDSTGNNAVMYVKGSAANGTVSFGAWTQLEPAGSTARNYISGCPALGNNQAGVVWTAANGTNFDIVVSALSLAVADTLMGQACL